MSDILDVEKSITRAAEDLKKADAVVIMAGAGMSADSGMPTFRDRDGFWKAFPMAKEAGVNSLSELATPRWFDEDPALAWGFYGKRLQDYRTVQPNTGYFALLELAKKFDKGYRVITTNVDGAFQRSGYDVDKIAELYGSIYYLQDMYGRERWPAEDVNVELDPVTLRFVGKFPRDLSMDIARPNICMFDDYNWYGAPYESGRTNSWGYVNEVQANGGRIAFILIGAGQAVPTLTYMVSKMVKPSDFLIRIDPSIGQPFNSETRPNYTNIRAGGRDAITKLYEAYTGEEFNGKEIAIDFRY